MAVYSMIRYWTYGMLSGFLLIALSISHAWAMHEQVKCQACHLLKPDAKNAFAKELREPENNLCLTCHDAQQDISGLHPPYVINGRKALAGGSFTPTLDSDDNGHNMLSVDETLGRIPPGGQSRTEFNCLSCHDPHTNGNFRNLKLEINGRPTPVLAEGDGHFEKNLYISGINNFCSACHEKFGAGPPEGRGGAWRRHPVGIPIYGAQHADFNHWEGLKAKITLTEFPGGNSNDPYNARVFCLSCHYAHGSPYRDALRWDYAKTTRGCLECHSF